MTFTTDVLMIACDVWNASWAVSLIRLFLNRFCLLLVDSVSEFCCCCCVSFIGCVRLSQIKMRTSMLMRVIEYKQLNTNVWAWRAINGTRQKRNGWKIKCNVQLRSIENSLNFIILSMFSSWQRQNDAEPSLWFVCVAHLTRSNLSFFIVVLFALFLSHTLSPCVCKSVALQTYLYRLFQQICF